MSENPLVLTFDVGTQSARAMLVDKNGNVVGLKQKTYEKAYHSPEPGWTEQDPDMYWNVMCEMSRQLKEGFIFEWDDIVAVTSTCIRATTICLDTNGRPLRDAIVWLDKRSEPNLPPLPIKNKFLFKLAGLQRQVETIRNGLVCNWISKNQPEIWAKTDKFVLLSAYLNLRFCGRLVDSTANTVGVLPFDTKTGKWISKANVTRCMYLIEDEKLYELVKPGDIIGEITKEAAEVTGIPRGLPYVVSGADKACETLALVGNDEHSAALSFGTTATIEVFSERYYSILPPIPPYTSITGGYLPEFETFRGYWLVSWFKKEFAAKEVIEAEKLCCSAEDLLNERLREVPPGCQGLIMQPTFTPDPRTPNAKGAVIGLSDVHTRIHLYRSIIEGINFSLMEGLNAIEKVGKVKIDKLYVTGGGSRSSEICQITADMFGMPVYRTQTHEACGVGSSMVAFVSLGIYPDYQSARNGMIHVKDEFLPDEEKHVVYDRLYREIYCKIFDSLVPLYEKINRIIKK